MKNALAGFIAGLLLAGSGLALAGGGDCKTLRQQRDSAKDARLDIGAALDATDDPGLRVYLFSAKASTDQVLVLNRKLRDGC